MPKKKSNEVVDARVVVAEETLKRELVPEAHDSLLFWHEVFDGLGLSFRHQAFVIEYVDNGMKARDAYLKIFDTTSVKNADAAASRLMATKGVADAIRRALHTNEVTADWIAEQLKDIARNSKSDAARTKALETLGRMQGAFTKEEVAKRKSGNAAVAWIK